jgi:phosphoglycolate phosphatase
MRHWIFDLDGTLVDSFSHYFEFLEREFAARDIQFTEDLRLVALTESLPNFFGRYFGAHRISEMVAKAHASSIEDAHKVRAFEGIPAILEDLSAKGSRMAILTNRDLASAQLILKCTGLDKYMEACLSGDCVQRKPSTEGILKLIDQFGCDPAEVTMVGDHVHDVEIARATGARGVRVSWHRYWEIESCHVAHHHFDEVSKFGEWIQEHTRA